MKRALLWTLVLVAIGLIGWSQNASADPVSKLAQRIENQQQRIKEGVAKGKLTRQEADMVRSNLNWIKARFAAMKRDRILTPDEIRRLDAHLDWNGRMIARETKDFQYVYVGNFGERIENQQQRIDAGIASGKLTRREADFVQDNLTWIKARFAAMKRDGLLTYQEMLKLDAMLDRTRKMIAKEIRDTEPIYWAKFRERIANQQRNIDAGIAKKQLTRPEADAVQDNLAFIKATFAKMKQDGRLTQREMAKLDELLDRNNQLIYKKRHDFDARFRNMGDVLDFFKLR